jgi:hypothetical protein
LNNTDLLPRRMFDDKGGIWQFMTWRAHLKHLAHIRAVKRASKATTRRQGRLFETAGAK